MAPPIKRLPIEMGEELGPTYLPWTDEYSQVHISDEDCEWSNVYALVATEYLPRLLAQYEWFGLDVQTELRVQWRTLLVCRSFTPRHGWGSEETRKHCALADSWNRAWYHFMADFNLEWQGLVNQGLGHDDHLVQGLTEKYFNPLVQAVAEDYQKFIDAYLDDLRTDILNDLDDVD
jgi:hypothetical protein